MKGLSQVVAVMLLALLTIALVGGASIYMHRIQNIAQTSGEANIIYPRKPPMLGDVYCYPGYGYVMLFDTSGEGINGTINYMAKTDEGVIKGSREVNISNSGYFYFGIRGDVGDIVSLRLYTPYWETSTSCIVKRDNDLVLWLKFDEGSGNITEDSSGNENNGIFYGADDGTIYGAKWTNGKEGFALEFDGNDDYVEIPDSASLDLTDEITIAFWVKYDGGYANWESYIVKTGGSYGTPAYQWKAGGGSDYYFQLFNESGNQIYGGSTPRTSIEDGNWHFLAYTYTTDNGGKIVSYLDGNKIWGPGCNGACGDPIRITNGALKILNWNGIIDEVRIYNRALNETEVQWLYQGKDVRDGLVAYYSFDEGSGSTAHDTHMWVDGISGKALYFDGMDDYVKVENFQLPKEVTVLLFSALYGNGTDPHQRENFLRIQPSANHYLMIRTLGYGDLSISLAAKDSEAGSSKSVILGKLGKSLEMLAGVFSSKMYGYKNGTLTGENELPVGWNGLEGDLYFGSLSGTSEWLEGIIDEVRIYNRALSEQEIKSIYEAYSD